MDGTVLARIGAIIFVAIAVTAALVDMTRKDDPPLARSTPALQPAIDPLREGQRRCQQMGQAAASDAECLAIWAETRDRFLGRSPASAAPAANDGR